MEAASEDALLQSDLVRPWVEQRAVATWQLPDSVQGCSSTDVRELFKDLQASPEQRNAQLNAKVVPAVADYLEEQQVFAPDA